MLIHGARAVLFRVKYDTAGFGQWVHRLAQRAPRNKVVVAIANKLARIARPSLDCHWLGLNRVAFTTVPSISTTILNGDASDSLALSERGGEKDTM